MQEILETIERLPGTENRLNAQQVNKLRSVAKDSRRAKPESAGSRAACG